MARSSDVYTGPSVALLALKGSDDDSGPGLTSVVRASVTAGQPAYVRVRGYSGEAGPVTLSWRAGTPLASVASCRNRRARRVATLPITLDGPSAATVKLRAETAAGTATAGLDYTKVVVGVHRAGGHDRLRGGALPQRQPRRAPRDLHREDHLDQRALIALGGGSGQGTIFDNDP